MKENLYCLTGKQLILKNENEDGFFGGHKH